MRPALIIAIVVMSIGCSLSMTPLEPNYDKRTQPRCETDSLNPIGDATGAVIFGALAIGIAVAGHDAADGESKWVGVGGASAIAAVLGLVSLGGFQADSECQAAIEQWDKRQIDQDSLVQESRRRKAAEAKAARREAKEHEITPPPTPPRGFYCSTSPATPLAGLCTRQRVDCERTRDAALAAIGDLSVCVLTEKSWCFDAGSGNDDERCAATNDGCVAIQARAAASGAVGDCNEVE